MGVSCSQPAPSTVSKDKMRDLGCEDRVATVLPSLGLHGGTREPAEQVTVAEPSDCHLIAITNALSAADGTSPILSSGPGGAERRSGLLALAAFPSASVTAVSAVPPQLHRVSHTQSSLSCFRDEASHHDDVPNTTALHQPADELRCDGFPSSVPATSLARVAPHRTFDVSDQLVSESTGWSCDGAPAVYEMRLPGFHDVSSSPQ